MQCKNPKWDFAGPAEKKPQQRRNPAKAQWSRNRYPACGWKWSCARDMWQQSEISWWELPRGTALHLQTGRKVRSMPCGQEWNWGALPQRQQCLLGWGDDERQWTVTAWAIWFKHTACTSPQSSDVSFLSSFISPIGAIIISRRNPAWWVTCSASREVSVAAWSLARKEARRCHKTIAQHKPQPSHPHLFVRQSLTFCYPEEAFSLWKEAALGSS